VTNERSVATRAPLSQRARAELVRAGDVRLSGVRAVGVGLLAVGLAIGAKLVLGELAGGDTGYILLVASVIGASWLGGVPGGLTATGVGLILNSLLFVRPAGGLVASDHVELWRQAIFLATGCAATLLVAARRSSQDRLTAALDEASLLADEVDSRDRRLELMLAASGTGFWEWDMDTGELTWSDAIFRQHGREPDGVPPDFPSYVQTIASADRDRFAASISEAVEGSGVFDLDFRLIWQDGSEHWTHGAGRVFRDEVGRPVRMIGTGQDITDQKRLETERDRLLADERRAGEFREAFIDVISHELRTPITTILGATEILANPDRVIDPAVRIAMLGDARAESERLYRLVEDLLVLSRVERGRLVVDAEPLDTRRLLARVVDKVRSELPSVELVLDLPKDLPIVSGEETYVEQILRNLLENAAKYSPAGTTVVVSARQDAAEVAITVRDAGPGIPAESLEHIFNLFYRDPTMAKLVAGSGIGLFVCRNLAEAMGGRMEAGAGKDGGSWFMFSLPVLSPDEEQEPGS
jgi:PAS domain S-box-containing protein